MMKVFYATNNPGDFTEFNELDGDSDSDGDSEVE